MTFSLKFLSVIILSFLFIFKGGTVDVTVHELLADGRVRELYKATGGAWGGTKVDEAFVNYFYEIFTKDVIEEVKKEYAADWVEMMREFEKLKRKVSLENEDDSVQMMLRPCIHEVYLDVMNVNLKNAFGNNISGTRGATLNRHRLQIPKSLIAEMIKKVAKSISLHTADLLRKQENANLDFIVMVGGFSNSPIVVQDVKDQVSIPVIVPENPELSVVQGAVMFGWKPEMFKSRKSRRTYGISTSSPFRENIDPDRLMFYDYENTKRCAGRFVMLVALNEDIETDQTVKYTYIPEFSNQLKMLIDFCESEKMDVTYCDEPGVKRLGSITVPMTDTNGDMNRQVEVTVRFGDTEIFVHGKDLTTGADVETVFDFL